MKKVVLGVIGTLMVSLTGLVSASEGTDVSVDEPVNIQLSGTADITSNYVFRGMSFSDDEPAIQTGAELSVGPLYAGVWGSTVEDAGISGYEADYYVGARHTYDNGLGLDVGYIKYTAKGSIEDAFNLANEPTTIEEVYAGASVNVDTVTIGGKYFWGRNRACDAWDLTAGVDVDVFEVDYTYNDWTDEGTSHTIVASLPLTDVWSANAGYSKFDRDTGANDDSNTMFGLSAEF